MTPKTPCFHCGEALPDGAPIFARLGDSRQPMCCVGCKSVAEFIFASGLDSFYKHRDKPSAELGLKARASEWSMYDDEDLLHRYVHRDGSDASATIDIGGMYCSACVWLLDNALKQWEDVRSVSVNPATRRALIRWNGDSLKFSELLGGIAEVGFKPSPTSAGLISGDHGAEDKRALKRLIVAAAAGMQVMMFAIALYAGDHYGIEGRIEQFLRLISLLVCLPIVFYSARPFFTAAYRGLRSRSPGMDLPVAIAIGAAFLASVRAVLLNEGDIYFDSVAMFVLFLGATRYLEMRARHRAEDYTQALAQLLPETVTRVRDGLAEVVSIDKLRVGDVVLMRPGDVVPADGMVISGGLCIDESLLTGETMPVTRREGMDVYAGGINRGGNASVRITLTGASTSLAEIGRLLERAKADKPPVALLADRIAGKFVVAMLLIASLTGLVWLVYDPSRAFEVVLATLVVTCPCALSLATPAVLAAAASRLARDGFLLVRSRVLDVLGNGATIVFDKTGTLTSGRPAVLHTHTYSSLDEESCLRLAAAIETASEHVLARAFAGYQSGESVAVENAEVHQGSGVSASVDGLRYRIGSRQWAGSIAAGSAAAETGIDSFSHVYLASEAGLLARFDIGDELRADAAEAIAALRRQGFSLVIASGDRSAAVALAARALGIENWHAGLSPAGKVALVRELQKNGSRVVMVGDGINDAPVLSVADASIAIDAGTALARASADAVALGKRLGIVSNAAGIARQTRRIIRQNLGWAILYNLTAVPLAAAGLLAPWMAAIGMSLSSLVVVLNALRVQRTDAVALSAIPMRVASETSGEALT